MGLFPPLIPTTSLGLSDIPDASASMDDIHRFAHTFDRMELDPYKLPHHELAKLSIDSTLVELRAHLFFEHRRWNHFGRPMDESAIREIRRVVEMVRHKLSETN